MKILVIGEQIHFKECQEKLGTDHAYNFATSHSEATAYIGSNEIIFDFIIDEYPEEFEIYTRQSFKIFLNTCKISLHDLVHRAGTAIACTVFGFNGMPTFFNRTILEVSALRKEDTEILTETCKRLNTEYLLVDDRVGLITPRVISMIINEAYYTVQEGVASREDIDLAMKLGTNYPYGPFEWCQRIGIKYVYALLVAVYNDTKDERYKICPLLKNEYLALGTQD